MFIKQLIITILTASIILLVIHGFTFILDNRNGSCIPIQPLGEAKGCIYYGDHPLTTLRSQVEDRYFLYYPGIFDHSGKECESPVQVTQEEYNRKIRGK